VLFHLIYVSTAVVPMDDDDLVSLLRQARARNDRCQITGMLLYKDGHFMQVLEGEEETVMKVFADIQKDRRHKSVDTLRTEYIQFRNFPDWSMNFVNVDNLDPSALVSEFTGLIARDFKSEYFSEESVEAQRMLFAFVDVPPT